MIRTIELGTLADANMIYRPHTPGTILQTFLLAIRTNLGTLTYAHRYRDWTVTISAAELPKLASVFRDRLRIAIDHRSISISSPPLRIWPLSEPF